MVNKKLSDISRKYHPVFCSEYGIHFFVDGLLKNKRYLNQSLHKGVSCEEIDHT